MTVNSSRDADFRTAGRDPLVGLKFNSVGHSQSFKKIQKPDYTVQSRGRYYLVGLRFRVCVFWVMMDILFLHECCSF